MTTYCTIKDLDSTFAGTHIQNEIIFFPAVKYDETFVLKIASDAIKNKETTDRYYASPRPQDTESE